MASQKKKKKRHSITKIELNELLNEILLKS